MEKDYDVSVEWLPFELHPEIPPEGAALPAYVRAGASNGVYRRLQEMAAESGRSMVMPQRMVSSRRALEASEFAREQGRHTAFHRIVFRKFYGEGQDMSQWEVIRAAAVEAGLDPDAMQQATESGRYGPVVNGFIGQAYAMGITGVPVYIFAGKYAIVGAQPYAVFRQAMARLAADGLT